MTMILAISLATVLQTTDPATKGQAEDAIKAFRAEFHKSGASESDQLKTIETLGQVRHEKSAEILAAYQSTGTNATRIACAKALAEFKGLKGVASVAGAALFAKDNAERTPVRVEILKTLAALGDAEIAPALLRLYKDRDLHVVHELLLTLEVLKHKASIPATIDYLKLAERRPPAGVVKAFLPFGRARLPGEDYAPQWNFAIRLGADDQETLRNHLLHDPLLKTLSALTQQNWKTSKGWSDWWRAAGPSFRFAE